MSKKDIVLPAYVERMKKEVKKLRKKIDKLVDFVVTESDEYKELNQFDKDLLDAQGAAMVTYANILEIRVRRAIEAESKWEPIEDEDINEEVLVFDNVKDALKAIKKKIEESENGRNKK